MNKLQLPQIKIPYLGSFRITWWGLLLALIFIFDFAWSFSILRQTPPRDGGELLLLRIFDNVLESGLPLAQVGSESYDFYPRSILWNYVMAAWKAIAGNDMAWVRLIPLGFYYLSAYLVFRILGGGIIGLAGLLTMLASNLRIYLTVCKPWTYYEALFLAVILLFKRAFVDQDGEGDRPLAWLTPDRAKKTLIWTLAVSALVYESAGLAALLVGMLGLVYLGWGIFREYRLLISMAFNVVWIVTFSYLLWKLPLFDLQGLGGAHSMFSPEKYPQMLAALWNGEFLSGIIPLMTFGFFKVVPLGLFFAFLVGVFLVAARQGLSREYKYYSTAFLMMICQVVLYFVLMKNRRWDMVESGRYIFQFQAVWILFIWLTVKALAESVGERWKKAARVGLTLILGLGVTATLIGEGRMKPLFEHNHHDFAAPVERLTESLKPQDRLYLLGEFRTLMSYRPDWESLNLTAVGTPPVKGEKVQGSGPGGEPFKGINHFTRTRVVEGLPWLADLVGSVREGREIYILHDAWPLRSRLEDYSPEFYYQEFQKDLYELRDYPELSGQIRTIRAGRSLEFPEETLGGPVLTLLVTLETDQQIEVMARAEFRDDPTPSLKRIVLNPGLNRIILFYHQLPARLSLKALDGGDPLARIGSARVEGLSSGLRTVLESSLPGRIADFLLPFKGLRSLALRLVKGKEGRAALEERRRYPNKAPDTILIFKVVPPSPGHPVARVKGGGLS